MRIKNRIGSALRNKLNGLYHHQPSISHTLFQHPANGRAYTHRFQALHISRIRIARHITRHQTLHEERYSEDIHARIPQCLNGGRVGPGVILVQFSGDVVLAKLCAGLVDSNPCTLLALEFLDLSRGRGAYR